MTHEKHWHDAGACVCFAVGYQAMGYFTLLESAFLWILVFTVRAIP